MAEFVFVAGILLCAESVGTMYLSCIDVVRLLWPLLPNSGACISKLLKVFMAFA